MLRPTPAFLSPTGTQKVAANLFPKRENMLEDLFSAKRHKTNRKYYFRELELVIIYECITSHMVSHAGLGGNESFYNYLCLEIPSCKK